MDEEICEMRRREMGPVMLSVRSFFSPCPGNGNDIQKVNGSCTTGGEKLGRGSHDAAARLCHAAMFCHVMPCYAMLCHAIPVHTTPYSTDRLIVI
jgi:hypothetical protein